MSSVTWVHLSDLHAGGPSHWEAEEMNEALVRDLGWLQSEYRLSPELLLFTGDLVFGTAPGARPLDEQYRLAGDFLRAVQSSVAPAIPHANVFIVPGNHDVERKKVTKALRTRAFQSRDEVNELLATGGQEWQDYARRLKNYEEFLRAEGYEHIVQDDNRLVYAQIRELGGVRVGIGGLNTSWGAEGGVEEKGRLPIGAEFQLSMVRSRLTDSDFSILLAHHPPGWFHALEDDDFGRAIVNLVDVFLHGHEHKAWGSIIDRHIQIPSGACYDRRNRENGYSVVRLTRESQGFTMEVFFRRYDADGRGWVARQLSGRTNNDGRWRVSVETDSSDVVRQEKSGALSDLSNLLSKAAPRRIFQAAPPLGREKERDECITLLRNHRAILLHGLPGQGKTALARFVALHLQEDYPDGAYEVDLQNEERIENIVRLIGAALGEEETPNPFKLLEEKKALIILDGFERAYRKNDRQTLVRFLELLVHALAGESRIIMTSQVDFRFAGLVSKGVRRLGLGPASELFHRESEGLYVGEAAADLERVVLELLEGHPLSIKIMARYSLAAKVSLSVLEQLWDEKWDEIARFPGPIDEKTLKVAFELSFESLDAMQQRVFLAFAMLPDGIFGEHIGQIWKEESDGAVRALAELERRSLLQSEGRWYKVLGPTYAYARFKRNETEALPGPSWTFLATDEREVDALYDELVRLSAPQPSDTDPRVKNSLIRSHFHNIHTSLDRRLQPSASPVSLAAAKSVLRLYWAYHNNLSGYKTTIASAEDAVHYLRSSRDIFRIHEQESDVVLSDYYIGSILWLRGETEQARPLLEAVGSNVLAPASVRFNIRRALAHMEYKVGSIKTAVKLYQEAMEDAVGINDDECRWRCVIGLIDAWRKLEEYSECERLFLQVEAELEAMHPSIRGNVLRGYAYSLFGRGEIGESKDVYMKALEIFESVSPFGQAHCRRGLGDVFVRQGLLGEAEIEFGRAIKLYDEAGKNPSLGAGLVTLGRGRLALAKGDKIEALEWLREALQLFDRPRLNEPFELAQSYEFVGDIYISMGRVDDAVGNYQLAASLYRSSEVDRASRRVVGLISAARAES